MVRNGVLVGVDGTEGSREVPEFAYRIAAFRGLPLTVLHCCEDAALLEGIPQGLAAETQLEEQRLLVAESVAGIGEKFPEVRVRTELAHGPADDFSGPRRTADGPGRRRRPPGRPTVAPHPWLRRSSVVEHARSAVAIVPARS